MKLDHVERPLPGARQEPAVEFGNVFRCQANVKRSPVLRYRDGIDFARKAIVESLHIDPRLVAERLAWPARWTGSAAAIPADTKTLVHSSPW